ncbi:MAG: hypothetical protein WCO19_04220 [Candidatus Saccharibacteria bacterium]
MLDYKRTFLGGLLFMIFVGEPTVGQANGLFTLPGALVLLTMYILLFLLYEALAEKYCLTYGSILPLTFGLYAVTITGLLHGEIANYVLHPQDNLITTLIRIQCSFFPLFAYYILNKFSRRNPTKTPSIQSVLLALALFILVLTPTGQFGIKTLLTTLQKAPLYAVFFSIVGASAVKFVLIHQKAITKPFNSYSFTVFCVGILILCLTPSLKSFLFVLILMPLGGLIMLKKPAFHNARI